MRPQAIENELVALRKLAPAMQGYSVHRAALADKWKRETILRAKAPIVLGVKRRRAELAGRKKIGGPQGVSVSRQMVVRKVGMFVHHLFPGVCARGRVEFFRRHPVLRARLERPHLVVGGDIRTHHTGQRCKKIGDEGGEVVDQIHATQESQCTPQIRMPQPFQATFPL